MNHEEQMSHDTELLLIYTARAQHFTTSHYPCFEMQVKIVLTDRFTDASFAYSGRGFKSGKVAIIKSNFCGRKCRTLPFGWMRRLG